MNSIEQADIEMRVSGMDIYIYKNQNLALLHSEVSVIWLTDKLKQLVWQQNAQVSVVYLANYSKYDSLFVYMGTKELYTEIRIMQKD